LSGDIKQLKELWAGLNADKRDKTLLGYANSVLNLLEKQNAKIGLTKMIGKGVRTKSLPAKEWVVGARREALWLTIVAKSRKEILERLCKNWLGSHWHIQFEDQAPRRLIDWIKENHPESKNL